MREFDKINLISDRYHMGRNGIVLDRTNIGFVSMDNKSIGKISKRELNIDDLTEEIWPIHGLKENSLSNISKEYGKKIKKKLQIARSSYPIQILDVYRISLDLRTWKNPRHDIAKERYGESCNNISPKQHY